MTYLDNLSSIALSEPQSEAEQIVCRLFKSIAWPQKQFVVESQPRER